MPNGMRSSDTQHTMKNAVACISLLAKAGGLLSIFAVSTHTYVTSEMLDLTIGAPISF